MTTSTNLGITHLEENASSPEVRVNEAIDNLDESMNSSTTINFASDADLTLSTGGTYPNQWQYGTIVLTDTGPVLTTGRNVIVPDNERIYRIINSTAQTLTVKTSAGTGIAVSSSGKAFLQCDGTNVIDVTPAGGATDANAIHDNVASEISALTTVTVASGDYLLIEDVSDSNNKKKVLASDLLGSSDSDAIHDNVAGEVAALTTVTVASGDYILIEDVSDSNNKKKILASDLLGGGTDAAAIHDNTSSEISAITEKITLNPDDWLLIEDSEATNAKKSLKASTLISVERNAQTGTTYTLVLDDNLKLVTMNNASSNTLTVPPNSSVAFPVGAQVLVAQWGAGQTTIAQGSGVTIQKPSTLLLNTQYSPVSLIKVATDEWLLTGDTE